MTPFPNFIAVVLGLSMASCFFLGGNIRKWTLGHKLDVWEKAGMVLHPLVILMGLVNVFMALGNKGSLAD